MLFLQIIVKSVVTVMVDAMVIVKILVIEHVFRNTELGDKMSWQIKGL